MSNWIHGIHHVTAIAGDPQKNVDFYVGVLGMRLVKKTVNFDDPFTYHLYYGDEAGNPGTLLTFFPWSSKAYRGKSGTGQLTVFSFSIPHDAIEFWTKRLREFHIETRNPSTRFGNEVLTAFDPDGFEFELIASSDNRVGWSDGIIPPEYAIRGLHSVTLSEVGHGLTSSFLKSSLGFRLATEAGNRVRFEVGEGGPGTIIDVLSEPGRVHGVMGIGTVHHVALRTPDDETQLLVREMLVANGNSVTPVIDRNYFHSIYLNEPGGVIFEVATDPPGFMIDEAKGDLGTHLQLPRQYEVCRSDIERSLPWLQVPHIESSRAQQRIVQL